MTNTGGKRIMDYAKDIKEILEIVKIIEIQNATRDASIKNIGDLAKQNYTSIEGNGKPGLKADVEKMQGSIRIVNWASALVGGAIILDLIARILSVP